MNLKLNKTQEQELVMALLKADTSDLEAKALIFKDFGQTDRAEEVYAEIRLNYFKDITNAVMRAHPPHPLDELNKMIDGIATNHYQDLSNGK